MAILTKVGVFRSSWADKGPRSGSAQETPQTPSPQKSLQRVCRESAERPQRVRRESVQETRKGPHKGPHFVGLGLFPSYNKSIRITTRIYFRRSFSLRGFSSKGPCSVGSACCLFFFSPDHRKNVHTRDEVLVCEGFRPPVDHPSGVGFKDGHLLPPPSKTRGGNNYSGSQMGPPEFLFFLCAHNFSKNAGSEKTNFHVKERRSKSDPKIYMFFYWRKFGRKDEGRGGVGANCVSHYLPKYLFPKTSCTK